jgi:4-diphosphocytidyl-2-C-methyl-D-erythritol kinase
MLERTAHAKVNLALHVTGQRDDGYHLLDSLVVFTEYGDQITISENEKALSLVWLEIDGPFAKGLDAGANNLVNRAALALAYKIMETSPKPVPVKITLTKNLPVASGIGGGSADAAATLLALKEFWVTDTGLDDIALKLGADVPMCLASKPLRARGIGDEISSLKMNTALDMLLVNPNVEVSTPAIFQKLETRHNPPILNTDISVDALSLTRNDLQVPAIAMEPEIQTVLQALEQTDSLFARMSGSGATCFALYETATQARLAEAQIKKQHPEWWCVATSTTVS